MTRPTDLQFRPPDERTGCDYELDIKVTYDGQFCDIGENTHDNPKGYNLP
jgi:hypothetical protein